MIPIYVDAKAAKELVAEQIQRDQAEFDPAFTAMIDGICRESGDSPDLLSRLRAAAEQWESEHGSICKSTADAN